MRYHVRHTTTYTYTETVSVAHNELHLRPRDLWHQTCGAFELEMEPQPTVLSQGSDYFGNHTTFVILQEPHRDLTVTGRSTVEVTPAVYPDFATTPTWDHVREWLRGDRQAATLEAYQFVFDSPLTRGWSALRRYAASSFPAGRPLLAAVWELTGRIHTDFAYDATATSVSTPLREVWRTHRGVCQDFAHLQIACLRALGLAARYVSGYLVTQPPPGQPHLIGADASHAWLAVYCPGHGWIDMDPTNNLLPAEEHITVAFGRDYSDVPPIKGVFLGGGDHTMTVAVDVAPL